MVAGCRSCTLLNILVILLQPQPVGGRAAKQKTDVSACRESPPAFWKAPSHFIHQQRIRYEIARQQLAEYAQTTNFHGLLNYSYSHSIVAGGFEEMS
jgi:hypothetical protein